MSLRYDTIVLGAGMSTRMGEWKLLLPLRKKTVIEWSVSNALEVSRRVILVGGYRIEELKRVFENYERVDIVFNSNYTHGMFSSIKCGVKYVETSRFFITLGDMPLISPDTYRKIAGYDFADFIDVVRPQYLGRKGHPVFLSNKVCSSILDKEDSADMALVLRDFLNLYVPVDDPFTVKDMDFREDYESFVEKMENMSDREDV